MTKYISSDEIAERLAKHAEWLKCPVNGERLQLQPGDSLKGRCLENANFSRSILNGVSFAEAYLQGADFTSTKLHAANFEWADLRLARFVSVDAREANFANARAAHIDFLNTRLDAANFTNADLQYANLHCTGLSGANMTRTDLRNVIADGLHIHAWQTTWRVVFVNDEIYIGCQHGTVDAWADRDDACINVMDTNALWFWTLNRDFILKYAEFYRTQRAVITAPIIR